MRPSKLPLIFVAGCLFAVTTLVAAQQIPGQARETRRRADSPWRCEPLLIVDCSGSTFTGLHHSHLSVYNNGRVSLARFGFDGEQPVNLTKKISFEEVERLYDAVVGAGGTRCIDQELGVTDTPLTTVTIFDGMTDAQAHTFSYWLARNEFRPVQNVIDGFIEATFND